MREIRSTSGGDSHPDLDQWIAYHGGELPEADEDRLRSHLAACRDCVSLVLDLDAFESPRDDDAVSEFETAAAWRSMKAALGPPRQAVPSPAPAAESPRRKATGGWNGRVPVPLALAASLLVGLLGLTFWSVEHRTAEALRLQAAARSAPVPNLAIKDLVPNRVTRSGGAPSPAVLRQGEFSALVILPSKTSERYAVEVVDDEGKTVWSNSGFEPDPELGTLTLGLPAGALAPGDYRVRLFMAGEETALEDDLPIRVTP